MQRNRADLPDMSIAPFWRPAPAAELGSFATGNPTEEDLALAPGWETAFFGATTGDGNRQTVCGWVRGPFGIYGVPLDGETFYVLTHVPTGSAVARFWRDEDAVAAAAAIEPLADWAPLAKGTPDLGRRVQMAVEGTGLVRGVLDVEGREPVKVWVPAVLDPTERSSERFRS